MCVREWRFDQECPTRKWLATRLMSGDSPKWSTCVKHAGRWKVRPARSLQDKKYSLASLVIGNWNSWLIPVAKWVTSAPCFAENWFFTFHLIPYYKYPYTYEMLRVSRENFERETLKKNKIDSSTILYIWFSKLLYSHPLYCHTHERIINQILTSPNSE